MSENNDQSKDSFALAVEEAQKWTKRQIDHFNIDNPDNKAPDYGQKIFNFLVNMSSYNHALDILRRSEISFLAKEVEALKMAAVQSGTDPERSRQSVRDFDSSLRPNGHEVPSPKQPLKRSPQKTTDA